MFVLRRTLEIGVVTVIVVMLISVSCVMCKACPSGFSTKVKGVGVGELGAYGNSIQIDDAKDKGIKKIVPTSTENSVVTEVVTKNITVWTANNHVGRERTVTFEGNNNICQNLPEVVQNRVQSVNTYGDCFVLCDKLDCKGWCVQFEPGSPAHNRLRKIRFHNRAESVVPCDGFVPTSQ